MTTTASQAPRAERGKRAAVVARRIEDDVIAAGWPVGSILGQEPELCARYGASRSVMFEAVLLVERRGVARMRRGPKGGLVVQRPDVRPAATALVIYLDSIGTTIGDLMDVRLVLEPFAAELAIDTMDDAGIVALRQAAAWVPHTDSLLERDVPDRLHKAIGEQCGNPVLALFLEILIDLSYQFAAPAGATSRRKVNTVAEGIHAEHTAIVEAIEGRDAPAATALIAAHLLSLRKLMTQSGAPTARPLAFTRQHTGSRRFAELLAERIRADLADTGAVTGAMIGSEAELLARYAASRQVLREAVRLLEHHGLARMRRGPGGGLFVAEPDPLASIEAIAVYLDYQGIAAADLVAVWTAVELACLDLVIARRHEPEVITRLRAAAALHHSGRTDDTRFDSSLHHELAALAHNPVLEAFFGVLTSLWQHHTGNGLARATAAELGRAAQVAHRELVAAIEAGDRGRARAVMHAHLATVATPWIGSTSSRSAS